MIAMVITITFSFEYFSNDILIFFVNSNYEDLNETVANGGMFTANHSYSPFFAQVPIHCELDEWACEDQLRCVPKENLCDQRQGV